jgi:hypothetical protein
VDPTRLQHVRARSRGELLLANPDTDLALEDIGELVVLLVHVRPHQRAGLHGVLNDRERSTRLVCLKLEHDPNAWTEVDSVAFLWADHEPLLRHAIVSSELAVTQPAADEATSSAGARPHSGYRPNLWSPASRHSSIRLRNGQLLLVWWSTSAPGALCLTDSMLLSALARRALQRELAAMRPPCSGCLLSRYPAVPMAAPQPGPIRPLACSRLGRDHFLISRLATTRRVGLGPYRQPSR